MTRKFSPQAQGIATGLVREVGRDLYSVIREPGITCEVCATPVSSGFRRCYQCQDHISRDIPLADRVGSFIYAIEGDSQAYKIVRNYKAPNFAKTSLPRLMSAMLALGLRAHYSCAGKLAGLAADDQGWAIVPSTRGRTKLHDLVVDIGAPRDREVPIRFNGPSHDRSLHPDHWEIDGDAELPAHVVVIDDSWVSGSNAQGVASALKAVGVKRVSVFTVARVMRRDYGPNPSFIDSRLAGSSLTWTRCPWTGGSCPE